MIKNTFYNPSFDNCERLVQYLTLLAGKPLTPFCIRQNIFKTSWGKRDIKLRSRSQLQAAIAYLKYLLREKGFDENDRLEATKTIIAEA